MDYSNRMNEADRSVTVIRQHDVLACKPGPSGEAIHGVYSNCCLRLAK